MENPERAVGGFPTSAFATAAGLCSQRLYWLLLATCADDATVALPPFDAVAFDLGSLWAD